jgi:hypothetical protein
LEPWVQGFVLRRIRVIGEPMVTALEPLGGYGCHRIYCGLTAD